MTKSSTCDEMWITKDGESIPVSDLTEEHAKNIVRMFLRVHNQHKRKLKESLKTDLLDFLDFAQAPDEFEDIADGIGEISCNDYKEPEKQNESD